MGNSGQGSCFCVRVKCYGNSLFAWSYRTKIVVGGRKIKQLGLRSLGNEGFGTGVFACCMRQILYMRRSNITASIVSIIQNEINHFCHITSILMMKLTQVTLRTFTARELYDDWAMIKHWLRDDWAMIRHWLKDNWAMIDRWLSDHWAWTERWLSDDQALTERWLSDDWSMIELWLSINWTMIERWLSIN